MNDMLSDFLLHNTDQVRIGLAQPFYVVENALQPDVAERLYRELTEYDAWQDEDQRNFSPQHVKALEQFAPDYSFRRRQIKLGEHSGPESAEQFFRYLNSPDLLRWASTVSGRQCDLFQGSATLYRENDHIASHNDYYIVTREDGATVTRALTFNYYLTKRWDPQWGGRFVWTTPASIISPSFNTLVLFLVGRSSHHHVEAVSAAAREPRLAITGWFYTVRQRDDQGAKKLQLKI